MRISIGSDHRGFALKEFLKKMVTNVSWVDVGAYDDTRSDYPLFAQKVCKDLLVGNVQAGVLICASGVGMAMAANRYKKIYAAVCCTPEMARIAKEDDGTNILVFPSDFVTNEQALAIFNAWNAAVFKGGRYAERLGLVDGL